MRNHAAAPLLALLLLAGCDRDPVELVQEINAARQGCTEEELRAGSEACVQMMERYAEMGTEAIGGYIGAVKALDQALRRMPAAQFDTAGIGHAISPEAAPEVWNRAGSAAPRSGDPGWSPSLQQHDPSWSRSRAAQPYPRDRWHPREGPYDGRSMYDEPYPRDPDGYDPGYAEEPEYGYFPDERQGHGGSMRPGFRPRRPYDARYERDPSLDPDRGFGRDPEYDPRWAPPARGRLLPPEQRLRRPWLDDPRARDPRWPQRPRYDPRDPYLEWEDEERPLPRRDPAPRYPR